MHVRNHEQHEDVGSERLSLPLSTVNKHVSILFALGLTFAGLHALDPAVFKFIIAGTSTILIPSTARSTTTGSPGFCERATLWTRNLTSSPGSDAWRAD